MALMVELLCAGLTGAHHGHEATSFFDADGPAPGVGQLLVAIDPTCFHVQALARFAALAADVAAVDGARLPGRRRQDLRREFSATGIPVEEVVLQKIEAIGR